MAYAVIMAGGKGERFWPLSTPSDPQLLDLVGDKAMIAQAVDRLEGLMPLEHIFALLTAIVEATVLKRLRRSRENIIAVCRQRHCSSGYRGGRVDQKSHPEAVFAILTADQVMGDLPFFQATLKEDLSWRLVKRC